MNRDKVKRAILFLVIGAITSWFVLLLCLKYELDEFIEDVPYNEEIKSFLIRRLVNVDPPPSALNKSDSESNGVIYILGGAQESLTYRFKTAADLYNRGIGKKILILSEPGITEYDPVIERNLTNDEWTIRKLVEFGVKKEVIEPVLLEKGFWGTFTEAKGISSIVIKRDCKHLTLVSSSYHTMRVWVTFSRFLQNRDIKLNICASNDHVNLRKLLLEYLKLVIYENVVLPVYNDNSAI